MTARPDCPTCGSPIDRLQRSRGVVAIYPCGHWLSPGAVRALLAAWRTPPVTTGPTSGSHTNHRSETP